MNREAVFVPMMAFFSSCEALYILSSILFRINATRIAIAEAGLVHAVHAVHDARLAHARNHLASGEARLEGDFRSAVVVVGAEVHAVLLAFFGIVRAESEQFCVGGDVRRSVGIDHAAHAAVHAAFHDDDAARDFDAAVTVNAVGVASAHINVVVAASDFERTCAAATRAAEATAAKSARPAATRIAAVVAGRCRCAACCVPAVVRGDDARDAAFEVHVGRFHAFVCHGDANVGVVLDVESFFGVNAVVVGGDGDLAARNCDVACAMETVVAAFDIDDAAADGDARIALDAFSAGVGGAGVPLTKSHAAAKASATAVAAAGALPEASLSAASCNLDGRSLFFTVRNDDCIVRRNAVVFGIDSDFAARDFDGALAACQIRCVVGIALDAVAIRGGDVQCAAADFYGFLAFEAVVLCRHRDKAVLDSQIVAGVDAVVVIAFDNERTFAFEGEVVLRVNASACRIDFSLARVIGIRVRFRSCGRIRERIGRAVLGDDESLVCLLDVNRGIRRVGERKALHVQIDGRVRFCGCD